MLRGIIVGIVLTLAIGTLAAYVIIVDGLFPVGADATAPALEVWAARASVKAVINRDMPTTPNPVAFNDANMVAGIKLYGDNCAVCHGTSDGKASTIAVGQYVPTPIFAQHGVSDDPEGETYWKIDHGYRFTGMPSFHKSLSTEDIWKLTLFLKHQDSLSPAADAAWKALPPAGGAQVAPDALQPKTKSRDG